LFRLPSPYPSSRAAELGNGLGYHMPRLPALDSRQSKTFVAPGGIERDTERNLYHVQRDVNHKTKLPAAFDKKEKILSLMNADERG
jgi:hypothetical protein